MWQKIKNIYHLGNAFLANVWFGFPSRGLIVIGVTGTDGKTTTVSLIYHILHSAGYNASMISSVGAVIGGKEYDVGFHVTTPSPWTLQRFVKKISNIKYQISNILVLETTSHALDQYRVFGIKFDIGVLTNITHEHLDYHKTYENYVKTKAKLLKMARVAVVNRDDNSYSIVKSEIRNPKSEINSKFNPSTSSGQNSKLQLKSQKLITYGMTDGSDVNPGKFLFKTKLIGEFNRYNVLAAIATCKALGISDKDIRRGVESFSPPIGREEIVYKNSFTVMIDFAHTPNAFEEILSSIKPSIKGRLIHVFGSAGLRDTTKRPLMGKTSAKYSDIIILTADDPRSESVEKIMEEIVSGIDNRRWKMEDGIGGLKVENRIFKIADRQEAINTAIKMARRGDFVLITGKSHEKSMNYGKGEEPWDEFGTVSQALRDRRDENNIYKFKILKSRKLIHGASTKFFGSIKNNGKINKKNLKKFLNALGVGTKSVVFPEQVHGSSVVTIDHSRKQFILNADGLITNKKNIFLGIVTADCLPLIFYDPKSKIVGIAHAGYKGLLRGILQEMVKTMKKMGADVKNIKIAIGPTIGVCCYDVSAERVETFKNAFKSIKTHEKRNGKYFLDLKNIAKQSLISEGVAEKNIEVSDICTKDNIKDFFSFRGEGPKKFGEFATIVGRI